ncbi:MAG: hypothetical protein OXO50_10560 [Caldilineaceae bacterium]|nr:hypothetical protein [Caldilineaceae bacterium]
MGENFEEIVSSPTGSVTFGSNTDFGALISAWEVESQAARDGQIVLRMAVTGRLSSSSWTPWTEFLMVRWLRVEVRSSPASEEKSEFRSDSNALGADANLAFMRMV